MSPTTIPGNLLLKNGMVITGSQKNKGLLDEFTGAAAAYSLRDLTFLRGNPVIRVRRSSDNTESDFTATEVSDGTLATWVGAGNNGFVRTWYDQSGNNLHAQQTTQVAQPKLVDSVAGLTLQNTKPAIQFDGTSYYLSFTPYTTSVYSNIAVIAKSATGNTFVTIGTETGSGQSIGAWSDGALYENNGISFVSVPYSNNTSQNLLTVIKNGNTLANFSGWQNGSNLGSYTGVPFTNITYKTIGARLSAGLFASGTMQEILLYSSDQTTNRTGIEANINAHYSIYP